jgi:hypothetical protein
MSYGTRYLELRDFIRYCEKLNVRVDEEELEYYEAKGIMLPMARTVVPEEYVKRMHEWLHTSTDTPRPAEWPEIDRLYEYPFVLPGDYVRLTDEELEDPFDREFGRNPYLVRPDLNNYRPWDSYRVVVEHHDNYDVKESTATHYYSYWQVHQLYEIQKYPDLYKNRFLIDNLPDEFKQKHRLPRARNLEILRDFRGHAHFFDALSFYLTVYNRERGRTFARIPEQHGVRTLDVKQHQEYLDRLSAHAEFVADKYQLEKRDLYTFLLALLNLRSDYQHAERLKLADELEEDIEFLAWFITGVTGQSFDEIAEEVGKRGTFLVKQEFRHLNRAVQMIDHARDTFERLMHDYNKEFPGFNISIPEIDGLLKFIEANGLFIIPYAIFHTDEAVNNPRAFRRTSLYMGMKNLTTGLECLIQEIGKRLPSRAGPTDTLGNLINTVFKEWCGEFRKERGKKQRPTPTNPSEFIWNITDVYTDPLLDQRIHGHTIRVFLIAYWARNLTAHQYTLEDSLYGDLYGIVYRAIHYAMFYTWKYALQEG